MLLINGVWWDDWIIWNAPRATLVNNWITEGNTPHLAAIHLFIYDNFALGIIPLVYRFIAFISGIVSLLLIWEILRCFKLPLSFRVGVAALVACSPMNTATILMCCMMYNVSTPLFFLGALLFLRSLESGNIFMKLGASISLFLSLFFWMSPIVVIPFMVLIVALWQIKPEKWSYANVRHVFLKCLSWWYIWIIPIIFWIVRSILFKPKAQFNDYYALDLKAILILPLTIVQSLIKNVLGLLGYEIEMISGSLTYTIGLLLLVMFMIIITRYVLPTREDLPVSKRQALNISWISIIVFVGALIPTAIIGGRIGDSSGFDSIQSRYQALMILPVSLILYALISQVRGVRTRNIILAVLITTSTFATVRTLLNYQRGWFKELAVVSIIKNEPLLRESNINVVVKDLAQDVNEYPNTVMPDYAYTGMSNLALDRDQTHRYISYTSYEKAISYNPAIDNHTIAGAEKCADPNVFHYILIIEKRQDDALSLSVIAKLSIMQYTNPEVFNKYISEMLTYTLYPIACSDSIKKQTHCPDTI